MKVIENFFVGLGVKTDKGSFQKAQGSFFELTQKISLTIAAIKGLQLAFGGAVMRVADALDELKTSAERVGTTAAELDKLRYAALMTDLSAGELQSSLQLFTRAVGMADKNGASPAAKTFKQLGISIKDSNGELKDSSKLLLEFGQKVSGMDKAQQMALGQTLGLRNSAAILGTITEDLSDVMREYDLMARVSGQSLDQMAQDADEFNQELDRFRTFTGMLSRAIIADFIVKLRDQFKALRLWLMDNADMIKRVVTGVMAAIDFAGNIISGVFRALGNAISILMQKWDALDGESKLIISTILAVAAAFWVLNKAMTANPIYRVIAAIAGLLLLLDDFQTFRRGGKSLIDWGPYEKEIGIVVDNISKAFNAFLRFAKYVKDNTDFSTGIGYVVGHFVAMARQIVGWVNVITSLFRGDLTGAVEFFGDILQAGFDKYKNAVHAFIDLIVWLASLLGIDLSAAGERAKEIVTAAFNAMGKAVDWLIGKLKVVAGWIEKAIGKASEFLGISKKIDGPGVDKFNESVEKRLAGVEGDDNKRREYAKIRQDMLSRGNKDTVFALDAMRKDNGQITLSDAELENSNRAGLALNNSRATRRGNKANFAAEGGARARINPENVNVHSPALVSPGAKAANATTNQNINNRQENNIKVENTFNIQATDPQGTASEVERNQGEVSRSMVGVVAPFPATP